MTGPNPLTCGHCNKPVRLAGQTWIHTSGFYSCDLWGGYNYRGPIKMADPDYRPPVCCDGDSFEPFPEHCGTCECCSTYPEDY